MNRITTCYDYEEYNYDNPLLDVDATYIIHLEGNGKYESIIDQLHKYPISKKVYIVLNKGYKKCKKHPSITKSTLDIIDAYLEIFEHAKNKGNILILEDDFMFDDKILEPIHKNNINHFIKTKSQTDFIYYIGALPIILLPYDYYNYKNVLSIGSHSVIYSKKFRDKVRERVRNHEIINDWDAYLKLHNGYVYYKPLCYQLFPDTENAKHWGDHNIILHNLGLFVRFFMKFVGLDKSIAAYSYFYFVSKLWILLFLFIIWILLTFIISLKM
jgi:hypothetical protein